jgi:hypothetical protein
MGLLDKAALLSGTAANKNESLLAMIQKKKPRISMHQFQNRLMNIRLI